MSLVLGSGGDTNPFEGGRLSWRPLSFLFLERRLNQQPIPIRPSTKQRHATKPSKIRDAVLTMSARAPANDRCFDAIASINVMPNAVAPSAQEWNDIRANMILAKDFKGQIRGWHAFMTEGIDALFSCCHRAFDYLSADAQSARTSK